MAPGARLADAHAVPMKTVPHHGVFLVGGLRHEKTMNTFLGISVPLVPRYPYCNQKLHPRQKFSHRQDSDGLKKLHIYGQARNSSYNTFRLPPYESSPSVMALAPVQHTDRGRIHVVVAPQQTLFLTSRVIPVTSELRSACLYSHADCGRIYTCASG